MEKNKLMSLSYDVDSDVLYLSIGAPRVAISREIGNDVLLRVDPHSGEIIGLTVLNLATRVDLSSLPISIDLHELAG